LRTVGIAEGDARVLAARSLWWTTPSGLRKASAMFNAASTRSLVIVSPNDQPTMRRLQTSTTTAR
jgi:hypothetical protein